MHRKNDLMGSVIATTGLLCMASTWAFAQVAPAADTSSPGLEEVVVTAQRRSEKQVDVPISISAIGAQQLATSNVQNLSDIAALTPSLKFDNQAGFFQPSIRGIGTGVTTSGGGSNVGIYIDGFYSPNPLAADFQLTNVSSIQVLKGPQGTLFGHNTTGGAILVTTAEPSTETHAEIKGSYGSFAAQKYQAYATTGLGSRVAIDVEGIFTKGDGFLTNILTENKDVGAYQNYTVRGGLKVDITDGISALARFTHSRQNDPTSILTNSNTDSSINPTTGAPWGVQTLQVPGTFTTNPNQVANNLPTYIKSMTDIAQFTVKADLQFANLTSYSQWRRENVNQSEDLDQTGLPIFQLGLPIFDKTISQEFLLSSKQGGPFQWTAGFFFFSNRDNYVTYIDNNVATVGRIRLGGSSSTTVSYAGYLDATYEVVPKLFLTAGVRYSHDEVKDAFYNTAFTNIENYVPSISSNKATPRAVVRFKPNDESSVYFSFSEGYKAAIIDVGGSCQDGPAFKCNNVRPEDVKAYEVGYKYDNRGFSSQTAAYYYDYKDLQVSEFLGNAQANIINAAKSQIFGLEEDLRFEFNEHFQINAGAAYTHARYKTFGVTIGGVTVGAPVYATCPAPASYVGSCGPGSYDYVNTDNILHGTHMQHTPDFTATIGPRVSTGQLASGEYSLSGNLYYTSKYYSSPAGTQFLQNGYADLALRAAWKDPTQRYSVALYGENVNNERHRTQIQYNGFGIGASWNPPPTWGIELGAKF
jgi:iron complex outermembrane recepter protein